MQDCILDNADIINIVASYMSINDLFVHRANNKTWRRTLEHNLSERRDVQLVLNKRVDIKHSQFIFSKCSPHVTSVAFKNLVVDENLVRQLVHHSKTNNIQTISFDGCEASNSKTCLSIFLEIAPQDFFSKLNRFSEINKQYTCFSLESETGCDFGEIYTEYRRLHHVKEDFDNIKQCNYDLRPIKYRQVPVLLSLPTDL
ncbi:hypothetical protein AKO1_008241 [Acrasis kona]|uniref:F-box domain-containing protein n=1 Tax=Acrasis kona TaxID=1008807 RepID=A0AAW2YNP6_9EUKA